MANVRADYLAHQMCALGEREPTTLLGHTGMVLPFDFTVPRSSHLSIADSL
jgi:hypothetical protein